MGLNQGLLPRILAPRAVSLWVWFNTATFMGVFRKENAAARLLRETR